MPLPTSWFVPKIAATELCTVPYSKLSTATRFFCCPTQVGTRAQAKTHNKQDVPNPTALLGSRKLPTLVFLTGIVFTVVTGPSSPPTDCHPSGSAGEF